MKLILLADLESAEAAGRHGLVQLAFACGRLLPGNTAFELPNDFTPGIPMLPAQGMSQPIAAPRPSAILEEPTIVELAANFMHATAKWAAAGFPVVKPNEYASRSKACAGCEFWNATARLGLGKCAAPGCGCTSLKRWLATEQCPLAKWPAATTL